MRKTITLLLVLSMFLISCHKNTVIEHFTNPEDTLHLLIPLYSFPTDNNSEYWQAVADAGQKIPIAVIWGMGDTSDSPIYEQWILKLRKSPYIRLYAYVATNDGLADINQVKDEVRYYASHFDIDGFFFDEVSHNTNKLHYYKGLIKYTRSFKAVKKIILNSPYCQPWFADSTGADIVLIFENKFHHWKDFDKDSYLGLKTNRKAVIIHHVLLRSNMIDLVNECVRYNIGYIYITDKEYDKLPGYWELLVNTVFSVNKKK